MNELADGSSSISVENSGGGVVKTTYAELKALRDGGKLKSGIWYRMTDYVCTTTQENTRSAGHQFDLFILALDEKTLCEECKACLHDGDKYFKNCKLEAWKVWYCIDNDQMRFMWADEDGKGAIYRLIDEWQNDVPYDFKNIQFVRMLTDGEYDETNGEDTWVYTFNWYTENGECCDTSIIGNDGTLRNDEEQIAGVYGNNIKPYMSYDHYPENPTSVTAYLNNIVFLCCYEYEEGLFYGCHYNIFGNGCHSNTFGNYCQSNTFGNECNYNVFGASKISFKSFMRYVTLEAGVMYTFINCSATTSSNKYGQNIHVNSGVYGLGDSYRKTLTIATAGNDFLTTFKRADDEEVEV